LAINSCPSLTGDGERVFGKRNWTKDNFFPTSGMYCRNEDCELQDWVKEESGKIFGKNFEDIGAGSGFELLTYLGLNEDQALCSSGVKTLGKQHS